jgi:hypothetical protein
MGPRVDVFPCWADFFSSQNASRASLALSACFGLEADFFADDFLPFFPIFNDTGLLCSERRALGQTNPNADE